MTLTEDRRAAAGLTRACRNTDEEGRSQDGWAAEGWREGWRDEGDQRQERKYREKERRWQIEEDWSILTNATTRAHDSQICGEREEERGRERKSEGARERGKEGGREGVY
ncbi:unnamed protein product [Tetraodon nigroviridis]|uniref:(spotted green pufferfish) hypothetical protein n=1 Tax=Tetraodon nigroviridis TaxID=99883 RepID=Q4R9Q0_TETNG|nr:unnamed protein product [Tetraodon nigroviridis]